MRWQFLSGDKSKTIHDVHNLIYLHPIFFQCNTSISPYKITMIVLNFKILQPVVEAHNLTTLPKILHLNNMRNLAQLQMMYLWLQRLSLLWKEFDLTKL